MCGNNYSLIKRYYYYIMPFIKLSTLVINTSKIRCIYMNNNKYYINVLYPNISGLFIAGSGGINSDVNNIEICKHKHEDDYNIITNWITTNSKSSF